MGLGFRIQGSGFRVQGSGFRIQGSGFRVQGFGFRVWGLPLLATPVLSWLESPCCCEFFLDRTVWWKGSQEHFEKVVRTFMLFAVTAGDACPFLVGVPLRF